MEQADTGAIILCGGSAVRLDGADKAGLEIAGKTLLEHALAALSGIAEVVVAGAEVPTSRPVTFRREEPAGGGPVAGVAAGLTGFVRRPSWVVLLAVDMPLVSPATISRLRQAVTSDGAIDGADGALLVDAGGRRQYLCGVYAVTALSAALPADPYGAPMRRLIDGLDLAEVPAIGAEARDIDTWSDLSEVREMLASPPRLNQD